MEDRRVFSVVFRERHRRAIEQRTEQVVDLKSEWYGRYLSRDELLSLVVLADDEIRAVRQWFTGHNLKILDQRIMSRQHFLVEATSEQIRDAFGEHPEEWNEYQFDVRRVARIIPESLAGPVQKISGLLDDEKQRASHTGTRGMPTAEPPDTASERADPSVAGHKPAGGPDGEAAGGMTPADIRRIYEFPEEWDGDGETIALVMFEGKLDRPSLEQFWRQHGIGPPNVEEVEVGPRPELRRQDQLSNLELAMSVEWAGALAPKARIVVYFVDPVIFADPWSAFLMEIIADDNRSPSVAAISWVTPERDYYRKHGHRLVVGLLAQAACLGITVVAAAGNWGPFDGLPRKEWNSQVVTDAAWPHGVFPAVEECVLGVGGTMITSREPLTEIAWSSPPPLHLQGKLAAEFVAGSGGFSDQVPLPRWQRFLDKRHFARGAANPSVLPYGRGFPDVAFMACGPVVQEGARLSCRAYQAVSDGAWVNYAGGTSIGAPIWAAILAMANQARRARGRGPVGWVNPLLYEKLRTRATPPAFRPIVHGTSDVVMSVLNKQGQSAPYRLGGYECESDWDPVTGLGVPHVTNLIHHLCDERGDR